MGQHEANIEILRKYYQDIRTSVSFHIKGNIPSKKIDNAIKKYASGLDRTTIIGLYDTTISGNGKAGYIFTDEKIYYLETLEKPKKIWYDDIKEISVYDKHKKDCDRGLRLERYDGSEVLFSSCFLNKTPLYEFLNELLQSIRGSSAGNDSTIEFDEGGHQGAAAGGIAIGAYGQVNKSFDEERFHSSQGHGFAAERANDLYDKFTGHKATIVGDDNTKNGADRIVDGVSIQSKYYQTGKGCIDACFDHDGNLRYRNSNGQPMQIEVPSDKYDAAAQAMREKIADGKVEGVTDPAEAEKIVRKGHFTYEQARNIAKEGTVESLAYDAVTGTVIATSAFGVTAIITFATSVWGGEDFDKALKLATYSGLKVGGTAFVTTIMAGQLSKAGLNSALVGSSEAVAAFMGPKASAVLINAFRSGSNIYGAAAMKSAAKLLRGNTITVGVTVIVLSSFDVANIFRGRISGKQLFKNLANTTTTVAGGTGGWMAGAAIGSAIFPGAGTIIGGLIGSIGVGAIAGKATDKVMGSFIEDDADEMIRIIEKTFGDMACEYLLSRKEAEKAVDKLGEKLDGKILKDMFSSNDRKKYARNLLTLIIENEAAKRNIIHTLSSKQMAIGLKEVLEDISDHANTATA